MISDLKYYLGRKNHENSLLWNKITRTKIKRIPFYKTLCVQKKEKSNIMLLLGWGGFVLPMKKIRGFCPRGFCPRGFCPGGFVRPPYMPRLTLLEYLFTIVIFTSYCEKTYLYTIVLEGKLYSQARGCVTGTVLS